MREMMRERVRMQADWEDKNVKELGYNPVVARTPDISTKKKPPAEQAHTAAGERKRLKIEREENGVIDDVHRR